jgi:hypothetical protein
VAALREKRLASCDDHECKAEAALWGLGLLRLWGSSFTGLISAGIGELGWHCNGGGCAGMLEVLFVRRRIGCGGLCFAALELAAMR